MRLYPKRKGFLPVGLSPKVDGSQVLPASLITQNLKDRAVTPAKVSGVISNIAYGTYAGDGENLRHIQTNFVCEMVIIHRIASSYGQAWIVTNLDEKVNTYLKDPTEIKSYTYPYLHATDGFKLGGAATTANGVGSDYKYVAFGHDWIL